MARSAFIALLALAIASWVWPPPVAHAQPDPTDWTLLNWLENEDPLIVNHAVRVLRKQNEAVTSRVAGRFPRFAFDPGAMSRVLQSMIALGPEPADVPFYRSALSQSDRRTVELAIRASSRLGAAATPLTPDLVALLKRTGRSCPSRPQIESIIAVLRMAAPRDPAVVAAILAIGPGGAACRGDEDVLAWIRPFLPAAAPELVTALLGDSDRVTRRAAKAILRSPREVTPLLPRVRGGLQSPRPNLRVWCTILLARLDPGWKGGAKALAPALAHSCPWIRTEAVRTLGRLARKRADEALPLVALLGDPDSGVASLAFQTFVEARPPADRAVPALIEAIANADSPFDRRAPMAFKALVAAYREAAASAVPHLIQALAREYRCPSVSGQWERRKGLFWAADCLGQLRPTSPTAVEALEAARTHDGVMVAAHATLALAKIRGGR